MMNKVFKISFALLLGVCLIGCSSNNEADTESSNEPVVATEDSSEVAETDNVWDVKPTIKYEDLLLVRGDYGGIIANSNNFNGSYEKGMFLAGGKYQYDVMSFDGEKRQVIPSKFVSFYDYKTIIGSIQDFGAVEMGYDLSFKHYVPYGGVAISTGPIPKEYTIDTAFEYALGKGLVDENGVIVGSFPENLSFEKPYALITKDGYNGVDWWEGGVITTFSEDIFVIRNTGFNQEGRPVEKLNFVAMDGTKINDEIYDAAFGYSEGYAPVKKDGKWGYINKQGELVVDYIFDSALPICEGDAWVIYQGHTGRLNLVDLLNDGYHIDSELLNIDQYSITEDRTEEQLQLVVKEDGAEIKDSYTAWAEVIRKANVGEIFPVYDFLIEGNYYMYCISENSNEWIWVPENAFELKE